MKIQNKLSRRISQGRGRKPADLVIRNVRLFDVITGEIEETDIAICDDTIVGTHENGYDAIREIDANGAYAVPGFIDTHLHIESSLVTPREFERCVLPCGTTTAICDPHEIANVLGVAGIEYFLQSAEAAQMTIRVQLSSCVPASPMETSGATILADDLRKLMAHPAVLGLAEFMNFPGVLNNTPDVMEKLSTFFGLHIDGHAPLLGGKDLNGYLSAGILTDHECTSSTEAMEKLRKGMTVLIREGSIAKDLKALAPIINRNTSGYIAFCTDDRNPLEIAEQGHINYLIRTSIELGAQPLDAYRMASLSAARAFGMRDRGLIAPGQRADIVLVGDLAKCDVLQVICGGKDISEIDWNDKASIEAPGRRSIQIKKARAEDFKISHAGNSPTTVSVIGILPHKIITEHRKVVLTPENGELSSDTSKDILKIAVLERHGKNGNIGQGFVQGFGFKRGAVASSVGHDSHNVIVVGACETDMAIAVNQLKAIEGGYVVVADGEVLAQLPLPVAGLMSTESFKTVADQLASLKKAAASLGGLLDEPFQQLAFLPLSVIPHLKLTDMGLADVDQFKIINLAN